MQSKPPASTFNNRDAVSGHPTRKKIARPFSASAIRVAGSGAKAAATVAVKASCGNGATSPAVTGNSWPGDKRQRGRPNTAGAHGRPTDPTSEPTGISIVENEQSIELSIATTTAEKEYQIPERQERKTGFYGAHKLRR